MTDDAAPSFQQPPTEPALRASDADRAATVKQLRSARREGRLTEAEQDERIELAQSALTKPELTILTADLVPVQDAHHADDELVPVNRPGNVVATVYSSNQVSSIMSTKERRGVWSVPGALSVTAVMGTVKLDMRQANFETAEVVITLSLIMGDLQLQLPAGVDVIDETSMIMAETNMKKMAPAQPGFPRIILRGHQFMAGVNIKSSTEPTLMDRIKGNF